MISNYHLDSYQMINYTVIITYYGVFVKRQFPEKLATMVTYDIKINWGVYKFALCVTM